MEDEIKDGNIIEDDDEERYWGIASVIVIAILLVVILLGGLFAIYSMDKSISNSSNSLNWIKGKPDISVVKGFVKKIIPSYGSKYLILNEETGYKIKRYDGCYADEQLDNVRINYHHNDEKQNRVLENKYVIICNDMFIIYNSIERKSEDSEMLIHRDRIRHITK
jgi:hypothetical protein